MGLLPASSQFSFWPQQTLKDFRNLKQLKKRKNFRDQNREQGAEGFHEEGKKRSLGVLHSRDILPPSPATHDPLAKAKGSCTQLHIACLFPSYALWLFLVPPLQGGDLCPVSRVITLLCHHPSGRPTSLTPHESNNFLAWSRCNSFRGKLSLLCAAWAGECSPP